jgi:hypothetical protein
MNMAERASLAVRICAELRSMGGHDKNKEKTQAVIRRETKGNPKDMLRLTELVEALI